MGTVAQVKKSASATAVSRLMATLFTRSEEYATAIRGYHNVTTGFRVRAASNETCFVFHEDSTWKDRQQRETEALQSYKTLLSKHYEVSERDNCNGWGRGLYVRVVSGTPLGRSAVAGSVTRYLNDLASWRMLEEAREHYAVERTPEDRYSSRVYYTDGRDVVGDLTAEEQTLKTRCLKNYAYLLRMEYVVETIEDASGNPDHLVITQRKAP